MLRQAAISYSTAFEVFLHDFLAEQIASKPHLLEAALKQRLGLSLSVARPIDRVDLEQYLAADRRAFQSRDEVTKAYCVLLTWNPFVWHEGGSALPKEESWQAAVADIELLWIIRHDLVHQGGQSGHKYRRDMRWGPKCPHRARLVDPFPTYVDSPPPPEEILRSPATDAEEFDNKLEEMGESARRYASYIAEMCAVDSGTR